MNTSVVQNDPLLRSLNAQQLQAVTMGDHSAIILAGAGSGKTSVLTRRAAYLIRENRAVDEDILLVTFTNKSATEMKERLAKMLERSVSSMWVGTFHGLCHRMLRENYADAGLTATFTIMDDDDQLAMCKRLLKDIPNAPKDIQAKDLKNFINGYKEIGIRAGRAEINTEFEEFAVPFYKSYESKCVKEGVVDFGELLLRVTELLKTNQSFLDKYRDRFSHIHVDEFQDTNAMQYSWLMSLKGSKSTIFAVGDDDQSIYAFRGASTDTMPTFVRDVARDKVIRLEQNYRSTGAILKAANSLIEKNQGRLGKNLWTDVGDGMPLSVLAFKNDLQEADHVARMIKNLLQPNNEVSEKALDPSQIAILYRSNYQSRNYEKAFMAHSIPYVIYGGTKFYERMEIKSAIAYMRLATNLNDDGAFSRIINFPPRGIGERTLEQISEIAKLHFEETGETISLLEAAATKYNGTEKVKEKFDNFVGLLSNLYEAVVTMPLPDFVKHMLNVTGQMDVYTKKDEEKDADRSANLLELVTAAKRFCEETETPGAGELPAIELLSEFLAVATLDSAVSNVKGDENSTGKKSAVNLMTVHSSKGLEFEVAIVSGADEKVFPLERSVNADGDEEERRLMYVAITRGRKNVVLTTRDEVVIYGEAKELHPSRFIYEIDDEFKVEQRPSPIRDFKLSASEDRGSKNYSDKKNRSQSQSYGKGGVKNASEAMSKSGAAGSPKIRRPGF